MRRPVPRFRPYVVLGALTLAACATLPPAGRPEEVATRFERIRDSLEAAGALEAQATDDDVSLAPKVSLFIPPAGYTMVNYVDAAFRVDRDAYVLVVTVDRDRRVRVLYPESPTETGFATQRGATHLTRFFGGFGSRTSAYASYDLSQRLSPFGAGGVLLAIASDRPLQLQRLADQDGAWDEERLEELVFERTLPAATHSVAQAVLLAGQEYSTDYLTYGGSRTLNAYRSYASGFAGCGLEDGGGFSAFDALGLRGYASPEPFTRFVGFYQRDGRTFARYMNGGGCGRPVYYDVPVLPTAPAPVPADTVHRDSTATTHRSAVVREGRTESGATVGAVSGLRFRTRGDLPDVTPRTLSRVSRFSPREVGVADHRPLGGEAGRVIRFGASAGTSPAQGSPAVVRSEPRIERRTQPTAPLRSESHTVVHRREAGETLTAH